MRTIATRAAAVSMQFGRTARMLLILAALMPILLFGGFAWYDYQVEYSRAHDRVAGTVDALAEHAQKVVETVDLVLARVLDRVRGQDWTTIAHSREIYDFLVSLKDQLPQVESVFLVDPNGVNVATSRGFPLPVISDSSRPYFIAARDGDHGLYISAPFKGQIAGTYAFTITRPRLADGRFDGLVGVTVSPAYFRAFYKALLDQPSASSAALVRGDGALLVRVPEIADRPLTIAPGNFLFKALESGAPSGVVEGKSSVDGHDRLTGFKRLEGVPLTVTYAIDRYQYLREWYTHVAFFGLLAALLSAIILLSGRAMLSDAAREHAALQRLVEETTRRQEAEAALQQGQKMEALGRLTGGVAHDFNNLLAAILGSLELLQKHAVDARQKRLIATARQAAERGAQLTAQMLTFARKQEVAVCTVDVNAAIRGMRDLLRRAIGPSVQIKDKLADDVWPAVADPVQLEIALLNLAVNARDAMPLGGELTIATGRATIGADQGGPPMLAPGDYVRVSVIDTGEGMSEEVRVRALEPFFTTKGPGKGTGLGLSMVLGFASLMGGTVTLESSPGAGTTISVFLPRAAAVDSDAAREPMAAPTSIAPPAEISRILLVDDDDTVRTTAVSMLEDIGIEVVAPADGAAALDVLATDRRFDLLVIDFAMPTMNGSECAARIREFWPDAPLLFITGYVENDGLRPWLDLGVPTLSKPFTQTELADALSDAIRKAQLSARVIPFRAAGT